MVPLTSWWPKLEIKILPHLAQSIESEIIDGFLCSRCLNDHIDVPNMIGPIASGATSSMLAKNGTKSLYIFDLFWPIWSIWPILTYSNLFWHIRPILTYFDLFDLFDLIWPNLTNLTYFDQFWPLCPPAVKAVIALKAVIAVKAVAAVGGPNWELQVPNRSFNMYISHHISC